jgi:hypothetical protein
MSDKEKLKEQVWDLVEEMFDRIPLKELCGIHTYYLSKSESLDDEAEEYKSGVSRVEKKILARLKESYGTDATQ